MKTVEQIGMLVSNHINNKHILEIACGSAEFSIMASSKAERIECIDVDASRLLPEAQQKSPITFHVMDATRLLFPDESFDTVIAYNAIGHLSGVLERAIHESIRVLKADGSLLIITNWKLDKSVIIKEALPFLESCDLKYGLKERGKTTIVTVIK